MTWQIIKLNFIRCFRNNRSYRISLIPVFSLKIEISGLYQIVHYIIKLIPHIFF